MRAEIFQITDAGLSEYASIPIAFEVKAVLAVEPAENCFKGMLFNEVEVDPYIKDYDAYEGNSPFDWSKRFDVSEWIYILIRDKELPVAGAVLATEARVNGTHEFLSNTAVLWDIRVHPGYRGEGLGTQLFKSATKYARDKGFSNLKAETQNTNVPACKFYAKQGCILGEIHRFRYSDIPELKNEIMLVWYFDLCP